MNITIETEARCPNCGTRYLKETDCGDYRCRDLTPRPHAKGQKYLLKGEELVEGFRKYLVDNSYTVPAGTAAGLFHQFISTYEKEPVRRVGVNDSKNGTEEEVTGRQRDTKEVEKLIDQIT